MQKLKKGSSSILWVAILGGIYSSTVTTVVLARRSKTQDQSYIFTGGILVASGIMYVRLVILLGLFNQDLMLQLGIPFLCLGAIATTFGILWSKLGDKSTNLHNEKADIRNPLEMNTAFLFGALFILMLIATHFAVGHFGEKGVYTLAGIMGLADVDPFIMSLTQTVNSIGSIKIAANAILIATASNNLMKGIYAFVLSSKKSRLPSLIFLLILSALSLLPIYWSIGL